MSDGKIMSMRTAPLSSLALFLAFGAATTAMGQSRVWNDPRGNASPEANSPRSLVDAINFETDTATVVNGKVTLACVADVLKIDPTLYAVVEGYADARGGDAYNLRLSEARAKAVAEYLRIMGAPQDRLRAVGRGKAAREVADSVTNFSRRKAIILIRRGAFDGEPVNEIPTSSLPCSRVVNGEIPVARIESQGHTFIVSVDYAKIRQDFRSEVARMLAERVDVGRADAAEPSVQDGGALLKARTQVVEIPPKPEDVPDREFRVSLTGFHTNLKDTETSVFSLDGAMLFRVNGGAVQTGIQAESGSYRKKAQFDLAYTAIAGPFRGTAFLGYANVSGAPTADPAYLGGPSGLLAGARIGAEWPSFGFGVVYSTASTQGASGTTLPALEPVGLVGADLRVGALGGYLRALLFRNTNAQKQASDSPVGSKNGASLELGYIFTSGVGILVRGESLPLYSAYATSPNLRETRVGLGIRFGGAGGASPDWVTLPTARMMHPY